MTQEEIKNRIERITNRIEEEGLKCFLSEEDIVFVKENINNEIFDDDSSKKILLIGFTRDKEFIDYWIHNLNYEDIEGEKNEEIATLAYLTKDSSLITKYVEEGLINIEKLETARKVTLLVFLEDKDRIKESLENKECEIRLELLASASIENKLNQKECKEYLFSFVTEEDLNIEPDKFISILKELKENEIVNTKEYNLFMNFFAQKYFSKNKEKIEELDPDTYSIIGVHLFDSEKVKHKLLKGRIPNRFNILKALYTEGKIETDEFYEFIKTCFKKDKEYTIIQRKKLVELLPQEKIVESLNDKELNMGENGRELLLHLIESKEEQRKYIYSTDLLSPLCRADIINKTNDINFIRACLENDELKLNVDAVKSILLHLIVLEEKEFVKSYIEREGIDAEIKDDAIRALGDFEMAQKWFSEKVDITSISELSKEDLKNHPEKQVIIVRDNDKKTSQYYTREEYIEIIESIEQIVDGIEKPIKGDASSELKCFLEIFKRLTYITYNYDCLSINSQWFDDDNRRKCRNLYGGLVQGKAVCAGYAIILKSILKYMGMECKYINGTEVLTEDISHAWNQVKIGEYWFNTDLTWERNECVARGVVSPDVLKDDENFIQIRQFGKNLAEGFVQCTVPITTLISQLKGSKENTHILSKNITPEKKETVEKKGDEEHYEI